MPNQKNTEKQETGEAHGVSLQPVDVLQQTFAVKFRGYDTLDVDSYLEIVAREMERLNNQNMKLIEDLRSARQELSMLRKKEDNVNAALLTVQKLAGDVQQKARAESERLLEEARQQAQEIVADAQKDMQAQKDEIPRLLEQAGDEARDLVKEARREANRMRDEMQRERTELQDRLTQLRQEKIQFETSFRVLIETHQKLLESNDEDEQTD
jgi:cell division initiation protein